MSKQPETQNCGKCRFFQLLAVHKNEEGRVLYQDSTSVCKRYPPATLSDNPLPYVAQDMTRIPYSFPVVDEWQWCGEYQPARPNNIPDAGVAVARQVILGDMGAAEAIVDMVQEMRSES